MDDVLKVLANPTNQQILSLLTAEPCYARRAAALLELQEAEVTRRLRLMENLGLLNSGWSYIGKNVKLYRPATDLLEIRISADGVHVDIKGDGKPAAPASVVPLEPIPDHGVLVGREEVLAACKTPVVVFEGMAGIGKTALMSHLAGTWKGPVFWHTFRGIESLNWLARHIGVHLANGGDRTLLDAVESGADLADKQEIMLAALDGMQSCFDDVHRIDDPVVARFITDAAQRVRNGRMLLTTRDTLSQLNKPTIARIEVPGLGSDAAHELLRLDGASPPEAAIEAVQRTLSGHPLALHLLASSGAASWKRLAERVPPGDLRDYLLQEVDGSLKEGERRILAMGSMFRNGFDIELLQSVSTRIHEADLLRLERRHLVVDLGDRYRLHDIIRSFYYQVLEDKPRLHGNAARHLLERGDVESRIEAMHHFERAGDRQTVLELLEENVDLHAFDFIADGYQNIYFRLLSEFSEAEVGDPRQWALIQDELGDLCFYRKEFADALAHYEVASAYFESNKGGDRDEDLAWKRAMALSQLGKKKDAKAIVELSLKDAPEKGLVRDRLEELRTSLS